jgi:hypothetical protein
MVNIINKRTKRMETIDLGGEENLERMVEARVREVLREELARIAQEGGGAGQNAPQQSGQPQPAQESQQGQFQQQPQGQQRGQTSGGQGGGGQFQQGPQQPQQQGGQQDSGLLERVKQAWNVSVAQDQGPQGSQQGQQQGQQNQQGQQQGELTQDQLAQAHWEVSEQLANNLQKLKRVIAETQQIAGKMEIILAQEEKRTSSQGEAQQDGGGAQQGSSGQQAQGQGGQSQ